MLFPSYSTILLFPLLSSPYGSNKVGWSFCTWIRCTRDSWYSNGPFNSDLVETFKTNAFNASFNAFVLDRVIGPFRTCNGSLLVFLGWSISSFYLARILFLQGSFSYKDVGVCFRNFLLPQGSLMSCNIIFKCGNDSLMFQNTFLIRIPYPS